MSAHQTKCTCAKCEQRRKERQEVVAAILVVAVLAICGLIFGCAAQPVVPVAVHSTQASFDGGELNSGILSPTEGGFIVTAHFRDRYNELVDIFGDDFAPALKRDDGLRQLSAATWFIDAQRMVQFIRMNTWRKSGRAETK